MNVFISQPFATYTIEEIQKIRQQAIEIINKKEDNCSFITNIVQDDYEVTPLNGLGDSIKCLGKADKVYFIIVNYEPMSRGCKIEYEICKTYDIPFDFININLKK